MLRTVAFLALTLLILSPGRLQAQNDGTPIFITSPDPGTTFAYASIKSHILMWDKNNKVLNVRVTFTDAQVNLGQPQDDTHYFRLPGVSLDAAKGIFYAMSPKGEAIPVAKYKKGLLFTQIVVMPNAHVRVQYPRGIVTVILEAISPNDPAMHAPPPDTNPDDTHKVNIDSILN